MQIKDLFAKDINRSINGVIKVAQDDTESMRQELSEYVITNELQRHFADFFEFYDRAIDVPTADIGVWISGFFGSGKSHFLKMLSYLLENREVGGVAAIDYFDGKVEDPMVFSQMRRAVQIPTETVLFNIDSKAGHWKRGSDAKAALLLAFARVFYEHQGFLGEDLRVAKMEKFVADQGKTEQFREAFKRVNGGDWLASRSEYKFYEDDIVEVMQEVLGMSEEAARHWFDGDETHVIAPDTLAAEIAAYAERKAADTGGKFKLVFAVDEVGQFIGDDTDLMLNLQTLVEEIGAKAAGRVWVMVTSQEAIDQITKVAGNDFSKIQGRFKTRLSLSSSSVDEVIKRRVLDKTDAARDLLSAEYDDQSSVLRNLFTFESSQSDLRGYAGPGDFVESYPFVGYQFKIMPNVLAEIRKHGNSGKHLSGGERSMLSGFQEAVQKVQDSDNTALVPLWRFYDTLSTFLEHGIRQVIDRAARAAEEGQGLVPADVEVLKTLYLIRYIKDVKPTIGNIAILMVDAMDVDKVVLRESAKGSLDRLIRENYVARNGDDYSFLTDEEQDVAREIANTQIDGAAITEEIKKIIFDDLYTQRKFRKGQTDFPFDRYVDDTIHGMSQNGMKLNVITVGHSELSDADDGTLALKSAEQALVVLPDDNDRYYDALLNAARIKKYAQTKNVQALPLSTQEIIRRKQAEASRNVKEAQQYLEDAFADARVAVNGQLVDKRALGGKSAKAVLDGALDQLVSSVFTKSDYITAPAQNAADVAAVLSGSGQAGLAGENDNALEEMDTFLESQSRLNLSTTMGDLQRKFQGRPFGWRELDIAKVVAQLMVAGNVHARLSGKTLSVADPDSRHQIADHLTGTRTDTLEVRKRSLPPDAVTKRARAVLRELPNTTAVPDDVDGLVAAVRATMEAQRDYCRDLLTNEYERRTYPGRQVVEQGLHIAAEVLKSQTDEFAFLKAFGDSEDEILDWSEDAELVRGFFPNQQRLFDSAANTLQTAAEESVYLDSDASVKGAIASIKEIIESDAPYGRIAELPELEKTVKAAHASILQAGKNDYLDTLAAVVNELSDYAESLGVAAQAMGEVERQAAIRRGQASNAENRSQIDAYSAQLDLWRKKMLAYIDEVAQKAKPTSEIGEKPIAPKVKSIDRKALCPPIRISTNEEIDAYVEAIKQKLVDALADADSVSVR